MPGRPSERHFNAVGLGGSGKHGHEAKKAPSAPSGVGGILLTYCDITAPPYDYNILLFTCAECRSRCREAYMAFFVGHVASIDGRPWLDHTHTVPSAVLPEFVYCSSERTEIAQLAS